MRNIPAQGEQQMDQNYLHETEARCTQDQPPGCVAACPLHVDVPALVTAIKKGDYAGGYAIFNKSVPFPGIISHICTQPCQGLCKRGELDQPITIRHLEQACVLAVGQGLSGGSGTFPVKRLSSKVAVIGAGLSGLTASWELVKKGYQVILFELQDRPGGKILDEPEERLPPAIIEHDLAPLLKNSLLEMRCSSEVGSSGETYHFEELLETCDAVFLGTGSDHLLPSGVKIAVDDQGCPVYDTRTLATTNEKVFVGGSLILGSEHRSPVKSVCHGKMAALSIDRFLQKVSLTAGRPREDSYETRLFTSLKGVAPEPACLEDRAGEQPSTELVVKEANRCLLCTCLECVKVCPYLEHYKSYPKKYVREIHNNLIIIKGGRSANEMINSCSLCGLCAEVCPGSLNMGEFCLRARRKMVETGKMPPSAHDFALQDMAYSTSDHVTLHRHQPGYSASKAVFFPGCQLGASSPQYVSRLYQYLRDKIEGGVGLSLSCCGAPAQWAGREDLFNENLDSLKKNWTALGNPAIITGCPTCYSIFRQVLPDLDCETIWTVLDRVGLPENSGAGVKMKKLAVHDACTTRHDQPLQNSIRSIILALGHQVEELENSRETTTCCGYGGLMSYTNRDVARKVVEKRIAENPEDYLAYCAICRDHFAAQGKRTYHLLDLIFGSSDHDPAGDQGPGFSKRQENRYRCKKSLLKEVWGEEIQSREPGFELVISAAVRDSMEERMILTGDIIEVISHARSSGNVMENTETGAMVAYYKHRNVTYWVEFTVENESIYHIQKAYSHRVVIKG